MTLKSLRLTLIINKLTNNYIYLPFYLQLIYMMSFDRQVEKQNSINLQGTKYDGKMMYELIWVPFWYKIN